MTSSSSSYASLFSTIYSNQLPILPSPLHPPHSALSARAAMVRRVALMLLLALLPSCLAQSPSMSPMATVSAPTPMFTVPPASSAPGPSPSHSPFPVMPPVSAPELPSSPPAPEETSPSMDTLPPAGAPVASMPGSGASSLLWGGYASLIAALVGGAPMFV